MEDSIESASSIAYYKGYYYTNFEDLLYNYTDYVREVSPLSMSYPSNGKGYDNHIYTLYFSERTKLGVYMEDVTREIVENIQVFAEMIPEILEWTENVTEENKAKLEAFAEQVKATRSNYNTIKTNVAQSAYVTDELLDTLMDVEMKVRAAKAAYGIVIQLRSLQISEDSTHRQNYIVGETFDMTGLELVLVYEDFSTEIVGVEEITLLTTTALTLRTKYVEVECRGKKTPVPVTVTEAVVEPEVPETSEPAQDSQMPETSVEPEAESKGGGCGGVVSGVSLGAITLALGVAICAKKKNEADSE